MQKLNQRGVAHLLPVFLLMVVIGVVGFAGWRVFTASDIADNVVGSNKSSQSKAVEAGKRLSQGKCQGEGSTPLTHSPMDPEDFSFIIPYGLMIGDHVTPIDHQYFSPKDYNSAPDSYEVYAMADGTITQLSRRDRSGSPSGVKEEYRFVFTQTCTFLYYYDLVTSLAPDLKAAYEADNRGGHTGGGFSFPVKAGQLVGYIGAQTLDFAVWDTTKPLSGFVNPQSYESELWKLYTADPLEYYADELKQFALSRYIRTAPPISGKIDYDKTGKLIGNWFVDGANAYAGQRADNSDPDGYWKTHLAIAPEHLDPSFFVISMGDYAGRAEQFVTKSNNPKPATVTTVSGPVKYELVQINYRTPNGGLWDRTSPVRDLKVDNSGPVQGTVLVELVKDGDKLKFEAFPGKTAAQVTSFTSAAKVYTR